MEEGLGRRTSSGLFVWWVEGLGGEKPGRHACVEEVEKRERDN
jgi:hypothetical protein